MNKLLIGSLLNYTIVFVYIYISYKYGSLKNWKPYYSTILFFILGNAIYGLLFLHHYPLWVYNDIFLGHTLADFLTMFIYFPLTTLIFLPNYPSKFSKQLMYNIIWVIIYTGNELMYYYLGSIEYHNGWNILWSAFHNTYQFPLIRLHQKNPILAWAFSFGMLGLIMLIFKFPIRNLP